MRTLSSLLIALSAASCVTPSCLDRVVGFTPRRAEHFATLTLYAEPIEGPVERASSASILMPERFERGAVMWIDADGSMAVSRLDLWPLRCPRIAADDLAQVSRLWQPILDWLPKPRTGYHALTDPNVWRHDWRPDGPVLSLTLGSPSGKVFDVLWDGRSSLPGELGVAVMATLEMVCSNSRLARRSLLRDLPPQVAGRLECRPPGAP